MPLKARHQCLLQMASNSCLRLPKNKKAKITKTLNFKSSRSFKIIDVNTLGKHVTSACCDRQQVSVPTSNRFTLNEPSQAEW